MSKGIPKMPEESNSFIILAIFIYCKINPIFLNKFGKNVYIPYLYNDSFTIQIILNVIVPIVDTLNAVFLVAHNVVIEEMYLLC